MADEHPKADRDDIDAAHRALDRAAGHLESVRGLAASAADVRHEYAGNAAQEIERVRWELTTAAFMLERSTKAIRQARVDEITPSLTEAETLEVADAIMGSREGGEVVEINQFRERAARYAAKRDGGDDGGAS